MTEELGGGGRGGGEGQALRNLVHHDLLCVQSTHRVAATEAHLALLLLL